MAVRKKSFFFVLLLGISLLLAQQDKITRLRESAFYPLNGWRFHLGDPPSMLSLAHFQVLDIAKDWRFQTDPQDVGLKEGWFSPSYNDSTWAKIDCGRTWEDQGFPNYDGYAWYRKIILVPQEWKGSGHLYLIFGGVDDEYDLFVNGKKVAHYGSKETGSVHESTTCTDIAPYVKYGGENLIAVRVLDWSVIGGIRKPPAILTPDERVLRQLGNAFLLFQDYDDSSWERADIGFTWRRPDSFGWFRKVVEIPATLQGFPVAGKRVYLRVGIDDEGEIYVNGKLLQRFQWDRGKVLLMDRAKVGERFVVCIRGVNRPGDGRLMFAYLQTEEQAKLDDVLTGLQRLQDAKRLDRENASRYDEVYNKTLDSLDEKALTSGDIALFENSLKKAESILREADALIKRYTDYVIPQSHIDAAWLWRWPETVEVCRSTFKQALDIMDKVPSYTFTQSAAQYYLWMEEKYPEIFQRIKQRVKEGRWGVVGGMWIEPDLNMPAGEALVRQLLYGKRYFKEKLGVDVKVGWNPDTFGHCWQLPQMLKKAGIDYYFHYRCSRGPLYWWEAPDGSRVLVRTGEGGLNEMKRNYDLNCNMYLIGPGDHGGGATLQDVEEMLQRAQTPVSPKMVFSTPESFFKEAERSPNIPVVKEELNFEFEGCYTSQAKEKYNNRKGENQLLASETSVVLASLLVGKSYPKKELNEDWRILLFNQFHDILPGSGIGEIYKDAQLQYDQLFASTKARLNSSLSSLASKIDIKDEGIPLLVFNPLSWDRNDIVEVDILAPQGTEYVKIYDWQGREAKSEVLEKVSTPKGERLRVIFLASDVPAWGYKVYYARPASPPQIGPQPSGLQVENDFFLMEVDPKSGNIKRLYDKRYQREVFASPGDEYKILGEGEHGMSAWTIVLDGSSWVLDSADYVRRRDNLFYTSFFAGYRFGSSSFMKEIRFYKFIPRIDVLFNADWQERAKMLKVAFPTTLSGDIHAFFETPYAVIERPSDGRKLPSGTFTPPPDGGHEVPALTFADISDGDYGVAILNDCKYGYDVKYGTIRLSLLRATSNPDPRADIGWHKAKYAIYPHKGGWREGEVLKRGWEFNRPLVALQVNPQRGVLSPQWGLVKVNGRAIATAIKQAEDSNAWILRLVEFDGSRTTVNLEFAFPLKRAVETNLLEQDLATLSFQGRTLTLNLSPYEIKTIKVEFAK